MNNNFDSSGYFAYKKSKIQQGMDMPKKRISRIQLVFQIFVATFVIIFIVIVVGIMKYSSKMDIEYAKGELQLNPGNATSVPGYTFQPEDEQRKIDKRLFSIQENENSAYDPELIEQATAQLEAFVKGRESKEKEEAEETQTAPVPSSIVIEEAKPIRTEVVENIHVEDNVIVMSKLLIGRYTTFEEAKKIQNQIKANNPVSQPFVRKIGNVFSVQIGSYHDFDVAKSHAQTLRAKGFDVWIYQQ